MRAVPSAGFLREFDRLSAALQRKVTTTLVRFSENPRHPSLRLEKLHGKEELWSIRVTRGVRITLTIEGDEAILRHVGQHDDVYRR